MCSEQSIKHITTTLPLIQAPIPELNLTPNMHLEQESYDLSNHLIHDWENRFLLCCNKISICELAESQMRKTITRKNYNELFAKIFICENNLGCKAFNFAIDNTSPTRPQKLTQPRLSQSQINLVFNTLLLFLY